MRRTAMSEAMLASLAAAPRRAATVWSPQPLQQHFRRADPPADPANDPTDPPADPADPSDPPADPADPADPDDPDKPLGPAGEKALQAIKDEKTREKQRRVAAEKRIKELEAAAATGETEAERQAREREQAVVAKANQRILRSEVRAGAAGLLADPSDAIKFLDLEQFEVGEDGDVDQAEIAEAIKDLIVKKPYLAAQGGKPPKAPKPDRRNGGGQHDATGSVSAGRARYLARHGKTTTS